MAAVCNNSARAIDALWLAKVLDRAVCRDCGKEKDVRSSFSRRQVKTHMAKFRATGMLPQVHADGCQEISDGNVNSSESAMVCIPCGQLIKADENRRPKGFLLDPLTGRTATLCNIQACPFSADSCNFDRPIKEDAGKIESATNQLVQVRESLNEEAVFPEYSAATQTSIWVTNPDVLPIRGVRYFPNFLTAEEEKRIIDIVDSNQWKQVVRRRQQFYGEIYYHTTRENVALQPCLSQVEGLKGFDMSQFDFLIDKFCHPYFEGGAAVFGYSRSEFPTQILVNEYVGSLGIASHFEDEDAFGDIIATISLIQPIFMSLERPVEHSNQCDELIGETKVLLEARSLFLMSADCRFSWRHGISRHLQVYVPKGRGKPESFDVVHRRESYRRISLTIRHLKAGRRQVSR